jgi:ABC-2 type transport system permease protein
VTATGSIHGPVRKNFMEKQVPWVSEDVAAPSLAFFRSMTRAPEVKMALFTNVIVLAALVPIIFLNKFSGVSEVGRLFFGTGAVVFTFFGLIPQMTNLFGFDRDGFRALVLSPARRRDVLLAKNLALMPVALVLGLALLGALTIVAHLPLLQLAAGLCKLFAVFMLLSVIGNFVSVWAPYRVTAGSLKPTKPPAKTVVLIMLTQFLFPVAMIPIFIPPLLGLASEKLGGWPAPLVDSLGSLCLTGVAVLFYWLSLDGIGDMMERREQKILLAVSREGE